jgi:hypothetical protein
MSEVTSRGNPKFGRIAVSTSGMELNEAVSSVGPGAHERVKGKGFRGNVGKDIKGVSGNGIGEVRDDSNAVPGIRGLIGRHVVRRSSGRKSRGRVRM